MVSMAFLILYTRATCGDNKLNEEKSLFMNDLKYLTGFILYVLYLMCHVTWSYGKMTCICIIKSNYSSPSGNISFDNLIIQNCE